MAKTKTKLTQDKKTISTAREMVAAYGGAAATARAFRMLSTEPVKNWLHLGEVPAHCHLGVYLGLKARGFEVSPKLIGAREWGQVPGVGEN